MHEIQIRLPSDDCDEPIQQMQRWLKVHHCEPLDFSVHDLKHRTTVVVVEFMTERELGSFAEQFAAQDGDQIKAPSCVRESRFPGTKL